MTPNVKMRTLFALCAEVECGETALVYYASLLLTPYKRCFRLVPESYPRVGGAAEFLSSSHIRSSISHPKHDFEEFRSQNQTNICMR